MTTSAPASIAEGRMPLIRRALRLEYFTVAWNIVEALVAVASGFAAGSIALVGFGLDSVIESISGVALLRRLRWELRLRERRDELDAGLVERKERRTLRVVGATFLLLAAYVAFESVRKLWSGERPETSAVGAVLLCLSLAVMPTLALKKFRVAGALKSAALRGDAKETLVCSALSLITLGGLVLNGILGWWWADPVAALVLIPWIAKEGIEGLRAECCGVDAENTVGPFLENRS